MRISTSLMMAYKNEKKLELTMNPSSPYYLHLTNIGLKLIPNLFSGVGFKGWKKAVSIALSAKNKMGFVDGTLKRSSS